MTLDAPKTAAQAGRRGRVARQGNGLHRRDDRRGQGPLPRRPRGPLSRLVVLVLRLADAAAVRRQEIAHGTAETEADGTFTIKFVAKPDLTVPEKDEPVFRYRGLGRRDRHQRRDALRPAGRAVRLHGAAGLAGRRRLAHGRQAGGNQADDDHPGRRAAKGGRRAEDLSPQAAGKGRAAGHSRRAADSAAGRSRARGRARRRVHGLPEGTSHNATARSVQPQYLGTRRSRRRAGHDDRRDRSCHMVNQAGGRGLSRHVRDAGPLRQEGHRACCR